MIVMIAYSEGGLWHQANLDSDLPLTAQLMQRPVAVKFGKWIYDFRLRELGLNPIRPWITYN